MTMCNEARNVGGRFAWVDVLPQIADNLANVTDPEKISAAYKKVRQAAGEEDYKGDDMPSKFAFFGLIGHKQKCHDGKERFQKIYAQLLDVRLLEEGLCPKTPAECGMSGVPSQYRPDFFVVRKKESVTEEDVAELDKLFEASLTLAAADGEENRGKFRESFKKCAAINKVGVPSLTSVLFMIRPEYFVPADSNTLDFWKKYIWDEFKGEISAKISAENYLEYCDEVKKWIKEHGKEKNIDSIPELSEKALEFGCAHEVKELVLKTKRVVLTGAPGTGKTYLAKQIAKEIAAEDQQIHICQFHPTYDYSDFVEGLRPVPPQNLGDQPSFVLRAGEFMRFCAKAVQEEEKNFVFIIDEINRGDISKIFGETFSALDVDYNTSDRGVATRFANLHSSDNASWDEEDKRAFDTFKEKFYVPKNVYIIGTMNDIDRSVESMDFAIRRRFVWKNIDPDSRLTMLREDIDPGDCEYDSEAAIKVMRSLNSVIKEKNPDKGVGLGEAYQIGGSYFRRLLQFGGTTSDGFISLWQYCIEPLLQEYFRGREETEIKKCMEKCKTAYKKAAEIKL